MREKLAALGFVLIMIAIGATAWNGHQNSQHIKAVVSSQLDNRVSNVATWCRGINHTRDYDRSLAASFHVPYALADLDCRALERDTAASSRP